MGLSMVTVSRIKWANKTLLDKILVILETFYWVNEIKMQLFIYFINSVKTASGIQGGGGNGYKASAQMLVS